MNRAWRLRLFLRLRDVCAWAAIIAESRLLATPGLRRRLGRLARLPLLRRWIGVD